MAVTSTLYATTAANNPTTGNTWTNPTNAQGAPNATGTTAPTNSATWVNAARSTVSVALECSGYNFQSAVGATSAVTAVTATIPHAETSTTIVAALTAQLYSGSTAIGAAVAITRATSLTTATVSFPTMPTYAQLADLRVRITATRSNSTTSTTTYIDAVGLAVTYVVTPSAPAAPTVQNVTASTADVLIPSGVADVTSYNVLRNGSVLATFQAVGSTYTDTTAIPSTSYTYALQAVNAAGTSTTGAGTTVTTSGAPSINTFTDEFTTLDTTTKWTVKGTSTGQAVTSNGSQLSIVTGTSTSFSTNVAPGIQSKNFYSLVGETVYAKLASAPTQDGTTYTNVECYVDDNNYFSVGVGPSNQVVTSKMVGGTGGNASSAANAVSVNGSLLVRISESAGSVTLSYSLNNGTTWVDGGAFSTFAFPVSAVKIRVNAYHTTGGTPVSNTALWENFNVAPVVAPTTAPTVTIGTTTQYTVPMSWGSVADATGFDVERDGVVIVTNQAGLSYTDVQRPASSDYSYRVRGVSAGGNGPWSSAVIGTTQAPTPVTRSTSFEGPNGTEVSLTNSDGDDFGWMTTPVGSTFTFDNAVAAAIASGSSCAKVVNTTAANIVPYRQWALGGLGHPVSYYRAYFYLPSLPNGTTDLLMTLDVEGSGAARGRIRINSANKLTVNFGPTLMTPAVMPVLTAAMLYRVEAEVNMPYGTQTLRLYEGHSTTLVAEETFTDVFLSFDSASMRIASATAANVTYYLDDVAFSNVDWIGPSVTSSSISGASALTAGSPTVSGAGALKITSGGALTPASPSLSGTGAIRLSGAGALAPASPSISGAGTNTLSGNSALIAASPTLSGTGTVISNTVTGVGTLAPASPSLSGTGTSRLSGSGALVSASPSLSGTGTSLLSGSGAFAPISPSLSGTGSSKLVGQSGMASSSPTLSGIGVVKVFGVSSLTSSSPTLNGFAALIVNVSGSLTPASPTLSGSGVAIPPVYGSSALTAASPSLSGAGALSFVGSGALIASSPLLSGAALISFVGASALIPASSSLSGTGHISLIGAGSLIANSPILSGTSIIQLSGAGALLTTVPSLSGSGSSLLIGSGTLVAASPTLSGIAVSRLTGVSALTASSPSLSSTAGLLVTGSGQLIASAPILIGTEAGIVVGSGALVAASPLLSGTGIVPLTGSGVLVSKAPTISGSGFVSAPAIAGVSALSPTPATLLGSGIIRMVGAGSLVAQPRTLSGTSVLYLAGSGVLFVWPSLSGSVQLRLAGSGDIISIGGVLAGNAAVYDSGFEVPPENRFVVEEDLRIFEVAPSPENIARIEWHNRSFVVETENRTLIALEDSTMRARKSPNAKLPFLFDWSTWLASEEDSASSVDWIVPEGLVKETSPPSTLSDGVTVVWLSGGTKGIVYRVICRITTVAGRIDERTLHLRISSR